MQEQIWHLDQWIQRELEVSAASKRMKLSQDETPNTSVSTSSDDDDTTAPTPCDETATAVPRSCDEKRLVEASDRPVVTEELGQVMAGHKVELHNQVEAGTGGNQCQIVPIVLSQCEVCEADCDEREISYAP